MASHGTQPARSTRRITRETGSFTRSTPRSRSLERGLQLLRAFLPGSPGLGNAELAERTGLARATVSRLTRSLVEAGFLCHDPYSGLYQLAPVLLSLGLAYRYGKTELSLALPLMREVATTEQVNVGLATRDGLHMVYLDTLRENHAPISRIAASGTRLAIEASSGGLAYLAALSAAQRTTLLAELAAKHGPRWPRIAQRLRRALARGHQKGFYRSDETAGLLAIARAVRGPDGTLYAVNLSVPSTNGSSDNDVRIERHVPTLVALVADIQRIWDEMRDSEND